jgi:hypothetical protein
MPTLHTPSSFAVVAFVLSFATTSRASETLGFVNAGPLASYSWRSDAHFGLGGELSVMGFGKDSVIGFGAFAQAQAYSLGGGAFGRYAAGLQVGSLYGVELGYAFIGGSNGYADASGPHVGIFASAVWVSLALRWTILSDETPNVPTRKTEFALAWTIKLPIQVAGDGIAKMHGNFHPGLCILSCS